MHDIASFELPTWLQKNEDAKVVLSGSATPALSINDLINLSTDKAETTNNLSLSSHPLSMGSGTGSLALRSTIATLYTNITANNIITTTGTTSANALVFQTLLQKGDHVISLYPTYTQLLDLPTSITGTQPSLWNLDLSKDTNTNLNLETLKALIKPTTKLIILNNPNNPTGTIIPEPLQTAILSLAKEQNIYVMADEIFRPLYHSCQHQPSFLETDPSTTAIITGSLSKAWGLSGVRVGWIASKNTAFLAKVQNTRLYTVNATSTLDEIVAAEALSPRIRPVILEKHLRLARSNLDMLRAFVEKYSGVLSWVEPVAGATAFVRIAPGGKPVDDVAFCGAVKEKTGVLLAPGTKCFGSGLQGANSEALRGFVRVHVTVSEGILGGALEAIGGYFEEMKWV